MVLFFRIQVTFWLLSLLRPAILTCWNEDSFSKLFLQWVIHVYTDMKLFQTNQTSVFFFQLYKTMFNKSPCDEHNPSWAQSPTDFFSGIGNTNCFQLSEVHVTIIIFIVLTGLCESSRHAVTLQSSSTTVTVTISSNGSHFKSNIDPHVRFDNKPARFNEPVVSANYSYTVVNGSCSINNQPDETGCKQIELIFWGERFPFKTVTFHLYQRHGSDISHLLSLPSLTLRLLSSEGKLSQQQSVDHLSLYSQSLVVSSYECNMAMNFNVHYTDTTRSVSNTTQPSTSDPTDPVTTDTTNGLNQLGDTNANKRDQGKRAQLSKLCSSLHRGQI